MNRRRSGPGSGTGGSPPVPEEALGVPGVPEEPPWQETEPSLARSTAVMMAGTGLSRITGLLRVVVLAATLGVAESKLADTYNIANTTPNIVYELVLGGILSSIFVPVFVEARRTEGREEAFRLARSVLTVTATLLTALAILAMLAAPWIIRIYTFTVSNPVVRANQQRVGTAFLVMFMPQIVFYGVGAVLTGLLNANRRFGVPMFAPVLNNLIVIATGGAFYLLADRHVVQLAQLTPGQTLLLGLGTTFGVVAMTLVQAPFLRQIGFRYRPAWSLREAAIRKLARLSAYTIGYVVVNQLGYALIPILANNVVGGYTAFTYAFTFFQLPHGIFAVSVMTALLPQLSEHFVQRDVPAFRATFARGVRISCLVLIPASVGYILLARPIVELLLANGVVTQRSVNLLVPVLVALVAGLVPFSLFQLALRAYYALQDTRVPLGVNIVAVGFNVIVDIGLYLVLAGNGKVVGLAIGNTLAYALGVTLLFARLRRRLRGLDGPPTVRLVVQVLVATAVMAGVVLGVLWLVDRSVPAGTAQQLLAVAGGVLAGLLSYLAVARLLRVAELQGALAAVRARRRRRPVR